MFYLDLDLSRLSSFYWFSKLRTHAGCVRMFPSVALPSHKSFTLAATKPTTEKIKSKEGMLYKVLDSRTVLSMNPVLNCRQNSIFISNVLDMEDSSQKTWQVLSMVDSKICRIQECPIGCSVLPQSQNIASKLGEPMRIGMKGPQTKKKL